MKTSGVSRFLSRRDRHHEKRSSKATPSKVRLSPSASCSSLTPLLPPTEFPRRGHQRHSKSLESLYHKLPYALWSSMEDGIQFFQRSSPNRPSVTFTTLHSTRHVLTWNFHSRASPTMPPQTSTPSSPMRTPRPLPIKMPRRRCVGPKTHPSSIVDLCRSRCFLPACMEPA